MTASVPWPVLPKLSQAAAEASSIDPADIVRRWFSRLKKSTRRVYERNWDAFAKWAIKEGEKTPEAIIRLLRDRGQVATDGMMDLWSAELVAAGESTGTANNRVSSITTLMDVARRAGLVPWRLERVAPRVEVRNYLPPTPQRDVEAILSLLDELAEAGNLAAARDAAITRLFAEDQMHRLDVEGLSLEHVDLDRNGGPVVMALRKNNRERVAMPISDNTVASLRRWLALRGDAAGPLFYRLAGEPDPAKPLSGESMRRNLASAAKQAGVRGRVTPESIRGSLSALHKVEMAIGGLSVKRKRETLQLALGRI